MTILKISQFQTFSFNSGATFCIKKDPELTISSQKCNKGKKCTCCEKAKKTKQQHQAAIENLFFQLKNIFIKELTEIETFLMKRFTLDQTDYSKKLNKKKIPSFCKEGQIL